MTLRRYLPTLVLVLWVLLISSGVSHEALRIPGLLTLAGAFIFYLPAERHSARSERRTGGDRRQHDPPT